MRKYSCLLLFKVKDDSDINETQEHNQDLETIVYKVLFLYLLFIKQPFLEVNHFLQTLTKFSTAASSLSVHRFLWHKILKQDWKNLHYSCVWGTSSRVSVAGGCGSALCGRQPWAGHSQFQPALKPAKTAHCSPKPQAGLREPVAAARGGRHSTGNAAEDTFRAGGTPCQMEASWRTAAKGDPPRSRVTPERLRPQAAHGDCSCGEPTPGTGQPQGDFHLWMSL